MTISKRLGALENRSVAVSHATRAWLGEQLTPSERIAAALEDAQPLPADMSAMAKEDREWLEARLPQCVA